MANKIPGSVNSWYTKMHLGRFDSKENALLLFYEKQPVAAFYTNGIQNWVLSITGDKDILLLKNNKCICTKATSDKEQDVSNFMQMLKKEYEDKLLKRMKSKYIPDYNGNGR